MPANFDDAFAQWLTQHGNQRACAVNVLQFQHPAFPGGVLWVSDFGEPFTANTEGSAEFTAEPLGFEIDVAADNVTTEQRVAIRLDNVNGYVAQQLRALSDEQLQTAVQVTYRAYLDNDRAGPQIDPLTLYVTNARMARQVVELEASADLLPNVRAGLRYTIDDFPPLVYL